MEGIITAIQRMSIHDGPGIRSTVFLKGCNFRCKWCHNPETWSAEAQLQLVKERCISCGSCVSACSNMAISMGDTGAVVDWMTCTGCGECVDRCVSGALSISGKRVTADELMKELMKDKPFYDVSGGGITLSGGESLLQFDFVKELLTLCKCEKVHITIESNLSVSQHVIEELMPMVDLWFVDLKILDDINHKKWTGASNVMTIRNLKFLSKSNAYFRVRTPVIPTVNDTSKSISSICEMLKELNITHYELLPFHSLGFDKFRSFGMVNPLEGMVLSGNESLTSLNEIVNNYNLK